MGEWKEQTFGTDMHEFKLNEPIEGEYKEKRADVGPNHSNIYTVGEKTFWGTGVLDMLFSGIEIGTLVRVTMTDESFKFPNGRTGRKFKVETKEE